MSWILHNESDTDWTVHNKFGFGFSVLEMGSGWRKELISWTWSRVFGVLRRILRFRTHVAEGVEEADTESALAVGPWFSTLTDMSHAKIVSVQWSTGVWSKLDQRLDCGLKSCCWELKQSKPQWTWHPLIQTLYGDDSALEILQVWWNNEISWIVVGAETAALSWIVKMGFNWSWEWECIMIGIRDSYSSLSTPQLQVSTDQKFGVSGTVDAAPRFS